MGTIVCQLTNQWMSFLFMWDYGEELLLCTLKEQNSKPRKKRIPESLGKLHFSSHLVFCFNRKTIDRCVGGRTFIWSLRRYMTLYFVSYMHDRDGPIVSPGRQGKCACYLTGCMHKSTEVIGVLMYVNYSELCHVLTMEFYCAVLCRCTANNF